MSYTTGSHIHGEDHYAAKVNEDIVREIRSLHKKGSTMAEISRAHGLAYSTVKAICACQTWKHVKDCVIPVKQTIPRHSKGETGQYNYKTPSKERAELGKKFVEANKNGDSLGRIGREFGVSKWTVLNYMRDYQKLAEGVVNAPSS